MVQCFTTILWLLLVLCIFTFANSGSWLSPAVFTIQFPWSRIGTQSAPPGNNSKIRTVWDAHLTAQRRSQCVPTVQQQIDSMKRRLHTLMGLNPGRYWTALGSEDSIQVWLLSSEAYDAARLSTAETGWPCVKATTTVNLPPEKLLKLLVNSAHAEQLSKFSGGRVDVLDIADTTKVVWHKMLAPISILRPMDFVSLVHWYYDRELRAWVVISQAISLEEFSSPSPGCNRCEQYINVHILAEDPSNKKCTALTSISHTRWEGVPQMLTWKTAYAGVITFVRHLRDAAESMGG